MARPSYPTPPTTDQVDDYHGTTVADPYRPLEDSDAPETRAWIAAQNELTATVLDGHPDRATIRARLTPALGLPARRRSVAPRRTLVPAPQHRAPGPGRPVDGGRARRGGHRPVRPQPPERRRHDRSRVRGGLGERRARRARPEPRRLGLADAGGSAASTTGEELPDRVAWSKFSSAAWTHDDAGFFYGRYPRAAGRRRVRRAEPRHGAPLSPARDRLGRRPARVLDARRARVGLRARGLRRRPAARRHDLARHRPREPDLRRRPRRRRRAARSCGRSSTRPTPTTSTSRRSAGRCTCSPTSTRRSAA